MKKDIMLVVAFLGMALFFQSCGDLPTVFNVTRVIKNNAPTDLEIKAYRGDVVHELIPISKGDSAVSIAPCAVNPGGDVECELIWAYNSDSVQVVFDDGLILTYCGQQYGCGINEKYIMALNIGYGLQSGYEKISENVYLFTITEEDYLLAE